jgi:hypothetical protein
MPHSEPGPKRHQLRVWLKWAVESGLLDKLPPQFHPDDSHNPQPTDHYARQLLAELRDPDSSTRPLSQIVADARRFRAWVEFRQKVTRRIILAGIQPEGVGQAAPERRPTNRDHRERREHPGGAVPESDPMWDDWLDA